MTGALEQRRQPVEAVKKDGGYYCFAVAPWPFTTIHHQQPFLLPIPTAPLGWWHFPCAAATRKVKGGKENQ